MTTFAQVEQYVHGLAPHRADDRTDWLKVGMAIHSFDPSDAGLSLWERFSSQSGKYKENECSQKWKGFSESKSRSVSIGSLSYMYLQDTSGLRPASSSATTTTQPQQRPQRATVAAPPTEHRKYWRTEDEAETAFYNLPWAGTDPECVEFFQAQYGIPKDAIWRHWAVAEIDGQKGIVYQGLTPDNHSAFKFKTLKRYEKKPGVWKRSQKYLYGSGSAMMIYPDNGPDDVVCVVSGEEKALAAVMAGYVALSLLNGEHALPPEWCNVLKNTSTRRIVLANDNDDAGRNANQKTAEALEAVGIDPESIYIINWEGYGEGADLNDILKTHDVASLRHVLDAAPAYKVNPIQPLDLWDIDRLFAYQIDETENILDDSLISAGELALLIGPSGIGKSRIAVQLIFDILLGTASWLNTLPIHRHAMKILIIQTENSVKRLKFDFGKQMAGCSMAQRGIVNNLLRFHVPLTAEDRDLFLDDPANVQRLERTVRLHKPDLILLDPYGDLFAGDNENDAMQARRTAKAIFHVSQAYSPKTAILLVHHSRAGREAASGSVGWDRQAYGRGSKALVSIARSQINVAPGDEENNHLIISCGMNNNGREFAPFAVRLDQASMRYYRDDDFSIEQWREEISSKKGRRQSAEGKKDKPLMDKSMVLQRLPLTGEEIQAKSVVSEICETHFLSPSTVNRLIRELTESGEIRRRVETQGNVIKAYLSL